MSNEIKVADVDQVKELFTALKDKMNSLKIVEIPSLKSFSEMTLDGIVWFINGYYQGRYTLEEIQEHWSVGDYKTVTLSAMDTTYAPESHAQQSVDLVILDFNVDTLVNVTGGKTKALMTLGLKKPLNESGAFSPTYLMGCWDASNPRRDWCNITFRNALPSNLKNCVKLVKKGNYPYTTGYNYRYDGDTTDDYCWIPSSYELGGEGAPKEYPVYYTHYHTASNRPTYQDSNMFACTRQVNYGSDYVGSIRLIDNTGTLMAMAVRADATNLSGNPLYFMVAFAV